jgi:predicted RNA binding protein YcfA (HicA-like mRNA interferase family)
VYLQGDEMKLIEVKKIFREQGWTFEAGGEHIMAVSPDGKKRVPLTNHKSKDIKIGTLIRIEKLSGVKLRN